jgi:hypothetical protein
MSRSLLADVYQTYVLLGSPSELALDGIDSCVPPQSTKTITGTVAGLSNGQFGIVSLGDATQLFIAGTSTNPVTFADVPPGPIDFVGTRMTSEGTPPDKAIVFRNLDIPDGGSLPATIDFNGSAASVPATASMTITGGAGDDLEVFVELVTDNSRALMWFDLAPSALSTRPWGGLSPSAMAFDDLHGVVVFATPPGSVADDFRVALKYVGPVANQTIAMGPAISLPAVSQLASGAYPRYHFQGNLPAEYNKGATLDVLSSLQSGNYFSMFATGAYLAASGNGSVYGFTMPDVSGLAGFPAAARLTAGMNIVSASGFGFTGPGVFDLTPNLGSESKASVRSFTITVP